MMSEDTVRLTRNDHDPLEIGVSQVTPATLARVFSVSVTIIILARLQLASFLSCCVAIFHGMRELAGLER